MVPVQATEPLAMVPGFSRQRGSFACHTLTTKQIQNKTRISALVQLLQKVKRTTFENVWQIALRFYSSVVL